MADECNPSLTDRAEKVSPLMLNLYLRAERGPQVTYSVIPGFDI